MSIKEDIAAWHKRVAQTAGSMARQITMNGVQLASLKVWAEALENTAELIRYKIKVLEMEVSEKHKR